MASELGDQLPEHSMGPSGSRNKDQQAMCDSKQKAARRKGYKKIKYSLADREKIIKLIDEGYRNYEIIRLTGCPESTLRTFRKQNENIKKSLAIVKTHSGNFTAKQSGLHYGQRSRPLHLTSYYLHQFLKQKSDEGVGVSMEQLQETARSLFKKVCTKINMPNPPPFSASRTWIKKFQMKYNVKCAVYQEEVLSSADEEDSNSLPEVTNTKPNKVPEESDLLTKMPATVHSVPAPDLTQTKDGLQELPDDPIQTNNTNKIQGEEIEQTRETDQTPAKTVTSQEQSLTLGQVDKITEVQTINTEQGHNVANPSKLTDEAEPSIRYNKSKQNNTGRKGLKLKKYTPAEKEKIIKLLDEGYQTGDIAQLIGCPGATVRNFRKQKDDIKKSLAIAKYYFSGNESASRAILHYGHRSRPLRLTEHFLHCFLKRRFDEGTSISMQQLQKIARSVYKKVCIKNNISNPAPFNASTGWVSRFKMRYNITYAITQGKVSSSNKEDANSYLTVAQTKPDEMPVEELDWADFSATAHSVLTPNLTRATEEDIQELPADSLQTNNTDEMTEKVKEVVQTKETQQSSTKTVTSQQLFLLLGRLAEMTEEVQSMNLEQGPQNSILSKMAQITKEVEDIYNKKLQNHNEILMTRYLQKTQESKQGLEEVIENFDFEGFEVQPLASPEYQGGGR